MRARRERRVMAYSKRRLFSNSDIYEQRVNRTFFGDPLTSVLSKLVGFKKG